MEDSVRERRVDVYIDAERSSHIEGRRGETVVRIRFLGLRELDLQEEVGHSSDSIEAKYLALIRTLNLIKERSSELGEVEAFVIHSDCWMMVDQYSGKSEVKEAKLVKMLGVVKNLKSNLKADIQLRYVPRKENLARTVPGSTEKPQSLAR
ncbi:MAG: reverse transcriptase-like protein [Thermoplasmata archaeon]